MHDLVIRGGMLIDGTGAPARGADVAIDGGRIASVGRVTERGRGELDARGLLVTPGFVDVHTHYDGQVTWDPYLSPSCWHGVTTVVMGNCGVGFAPADPARHEWLISLMEGVEDIPGTALHEGIRWGWEHFSEYLDQVERLPHAIDVAAQLPHGALRAYVMGERGSDHTAKPNADEIAAMAREARAAVEAGALGFSTSRTVNHRTKAGAHTPSLTASAEELLGIGRGLRDAAKGVFQLVADFFDLESEFALIRRLAAECRRPLSFSLLQSDRSPDDWRRLLELTEQAVRDGVPIRAQVASRPVGLLMGLEASVHPFAGCPSYAAIAALPLDLRVKRMREPALRARLVAEKDAQPAAIFSLEKLFMLGDPPNYEPRAEDSIAARAHAEGISANELLYDSLLARDGHELLYAPVMNYHGFDMEACREMLVHPLTVPGLGDAGAHCGLICDGSFVTTLLTHWGRDRSRGARIPLETLVRWHTQDTASLVGLGDRGVVAAGKKADLNLIDWDHLQLHPPETLFDLPAGGRRLVQRADGYRATIVSGEVVVRDGATTGALPGVLVRGARAA
jgi:N-acyl-D-aspartate/D-glutamate deacylase